jgi:hypothetical protein
LSGKGHQWKPGESGNPSGGPLGGRRKALLALDKFLSKDQSLSALVKFWDAELQENPRRFCNEIWRPLLPKESILELSGGSEMGRGVLLAIARVLNGANPTEEMQDDPGATGDSPG